MGYFVSRQNYYYSQESVVEVETNGIDFAGPDMLGKKYKGEMQEYDDPRQAMDAAIRIRDEWRKDEPNESIQVAFGTTGGMGMEMEPTSLTDDELREWASAQWDKLPKCDQCAEMIHDKHYIIDYPEAGDFCSESCCSKFIEENYVHEEEE